MVKKFGLLFFGIVQLHYLIESVYSVGQNCLQTGFDDSGSGVVHGVSEGEK